MYNCKQHIDEVWELFLFLEMQILVKYTKTKASEEKDDLTANAKSDRVAYDSWTVVSSDKVASLEVFRTLLCSSGLNGRF